MTQVTLPYVGSSLLLLFFLPGWEWKRLKGCVFSPPFLLPVLGGQKEARKRNLSIASIPVCLQFLPRSGNDSLPEHLDHGLPQLGAREVSVVVLVQRVERRQVEARRTVAQGADNDRIR